MSCRTQWSGWCCPHSGSQAAAHSWTQPVALRLNQDQVNTATRYALWGLLPDRQLLCPYWDSNHPLIAHLLNDWLRSQDFLWGHLFHTGHDCAKNICVVMPVHTLLSHYMCTLHIIASKLLFSKSDPKMFCWPLYIPFVSVVCVGLVAL